MNTLLEMESRLWDYIDGRLTDLEREQVEALIESEPEWKNKWEELIDLQLLMQADDLEAPSMRFTKNVMESITQAQIAPASSSYINKHLIRGIAIFLICAVLGTFVYSISQMDFSSAASDPLSNKWNLEIKAFDWSVFFNNSYIQVALGLNLILGLYLLDQWMNSRRKKWKHTISKSSQNQ